MRTISPLALAAAALAALPAAAQEISDGKVKIGILNDQSGVYADFGGKWSFEAAKMAAEDFGGTVLGAPIEIVTADHQNKPDIASSIAREWYDTQQVELDHGADDLVGGAGGAGAVEGEAEDRHRHRRGDDRAHRRRSARPTASTGPTTPIRRRSGPAGR